MNAADLETLAAAVHRAACAIAEAKHFAVVESSQRYLHGKAPAKRKAEHAETAERASAQARHEVEQALLHLADATARAEALRA